MFKRLIILGWAWMAAVAMHAQDNMGKVWFSMPDSLAPAYLKADKRRAMVDYYGMGEIAEVTHDLQGTSVMDSLSASYAKVTLSETLSLQLALLPMLRGDTVLCRVTTYAAPASESRVDFFDTAWHRLDTDAFLPDMPFDSFLQKPDTLSDEEFRHLCRFFEPQMIRIWLDPDDFSLSFALSTPLTSRLDRERLEAIMVQRKLNWDGEKYK